MIVLYILGGIALLIALLLSLSVTVTIIYEKEVELKAKYLCFTLYQIPEKVKKKKKKTVRNKKQSDNAQPVPEKPLKAENTNSASEKAIPEKITAEVKPKPPAKKAETAVTTKKAAPEHKAEQTEQTDKLPEKESSEKSEKTSDEKPQEKEKTSTSAETNSEKKAKMDLEQIMQMIENAKPPALRLFRKIRLKKIYIDIVVGGEDSAQVALNYGKFNIAVNGFICWLENTFTTEVKEVNIEADFDKEQSDIFAHAKLKLRLSTMIACVIWFFGRTMKGAAKPAHKAPPKKKKKKPNMIKDGK